MGNLLAIPDGTAAWRICRETARRPGEIKGPDKQPLRFPIDTTSDELVEMCGPGVYRIYALDELGKQLGHVSTWDLTPGPRELRNATAELAAAVASEHTSPPMTDLRFALEAMQAMMRTNSDALRHGRRVARRSREDDRGGQGHAAQRDRCAVRAVPQREPTTTRTRKKSGQALGRADDAVRREGGRDRARARDGQGHAEELRTIRARRGSRVARPPMHDLASKPNWEARDFVDLNYAAAKAKAKKAAKQAAEAGASAAPKPSLQARVMADPKLMAQFVAIKSLLSAAESAQLLELGQRMSEQEQEWLLAQISAVSPENAAALLRGMLAELGEAKPSTDPSK